MKQTVLSAFLVLLAMSMVPSANAQLTFPPYLPTECEQQARESFDGATDAVVAAIITVGLEVPIGEATIDLSMNMDNGTSPLWIYAVASNSLDSIKIVPMIRVLGICQETPLEDIDGISTELGLSPVALPPSYNQGQPLMNLLKADPLYSQFSAAYPDSAPTFAALGTVEEGFGEFPANSPFWIFQWGIESDDGAFICVSHAETGETLCLGEVPSSVAEEARRAGFRVAPNPANDFVIVTIPETWVGTGVSISAVSPAGQVIPMLSADQARSQRIPLSIAKIPSGYWSLLITNGASAQTLPLSVVR